MGLSAIVTVLGIIAAIIAISTFLARLWGRLHPETIGIEGVWGDKFLVKGQEGEELRAAVLFIKKTRKGYSILGEEYDKNLEVVYTWNSLAVTSFEPGKVEYFFNATETLPDGVHHRDMKGFTSLRFFGTSEKHPETYSGDFVDFWYESGKICTRSGHIKKGRRIAEREALRSYDSHEGRRSLAKQLLKGNNRI